VGKAALPSGAGLLLLRGTLGNQELLLPPLTSHGGDQVPIAVVLRRNRGAGIVALWNMHSNEPVGLVGDGSHVRRVVLRQQDAYLAREALQEEVSKNGSGRLAGWAELEHLRQEDGGLPVAQGGQPHHPLHFLVVGESVGSQQRRTQVVVGERPGVLVKDVTDEAHSVLRKRGEDVVVACHGVDDVAEVELPLRQPKSRDRILSPETGKFDQRLMIGRLASARRRWRLLLIILHEEEAGSPVLRCE
jgi:hypothetical protein